jgi:hypothetical protein
MADGIGGRRHQTSLALSAEQATKEQVTEQFRAAGGMKTIENLTLVL